MVSPVTLPWPPPWPRTAAPAPELEAGWEDCAIRAWYMSQCFTSLSSPNYSLGIVHLQQIFVKRWCVPPLPNSWNINHNPCRYITIYNTRWRCQNNMSLPLELDFAPNKMIRNWHNTWCSTQGKLLVPWWIKNLPSEPQNSWLIVISVLTHPNIIYTDNIW